MTLRQLIIYRPFLDMEVKQEVDTLMYNATDLLKAYNAKFGENKLMSNYLGSSDTREYIKYIMQQESKDVKSTHLEKEHTDEENLKLNLEKPKVEGVISVKRGKFGGTWMNQHLLVDFMMWLSVEFKHAAIDFILNGQSLAIGRNKIKEGYKRMCKAIAESGSANYRDEATMLNVLISGSPSSNQRARYGEDKMELMDDMQKSNATMIRLGMSLEDRKNALINEFVK